MIEPFFEQKWFDHSFRKCYPCFRHLQNFVFLSFETENFGAHSWMSRFLCMRFWSGFRGRPTPVRSSLLVWYFQMSCTAKMILSSTCLFLAHMACSKVWKRRIFFRWCVLSWRSMFMRRKTVKLQIVLWMFFMTSPFLQNMSTVEEKRRFVEKPASSYLLFSQMHIQTNAVWRSRPLVLTIRGSWGTKNEETEIQSLLQECTFHGQLFATGD